MYKSHETTKGRTHEFPNHVFWKYITYREKTHVQVLHRLRVCKKHSKPKKRTTHVKVRHHIFDNIGGHMILHNHMNNKMSDT